MNCEHCAELLPELIENALPANDVRAVREHLAGCTTCRNDLRELNAITAAARMLNDVEPGANTILRTMEAIHADATAPRRTEFGPVMDIEELADYLHVDRDTVEEYLEDLPYFELGGKLLFRRKSIENWIEAREQGFAAPMRVAVPVAGRVSPRQRGGMRWML
jgi:excisionase family DNA binding protein